MIDREQSVLTQAFIDRKPHSAARVLEAIDAADAAAFLDSAPARIVAPAVSAMIPWSAARCVEIMNTERASGLLRAMQYPDAVSILRQMEAMRREALLDLSTKRFARSFRNSLIYPKDTVGAWMDVGVPSFQDTTLVKDAIRAVRRMPNIASHVLLTDTNKRFAGAVPVTELLRRTGNVTLAEIADHSIKPLSNRDSLYACNVNTAWDALTTMPVVGRKRNLVGGLSRGTLRKALHSQDPIIEVATPTSVLMQLFGAFVTVGTAFANLTLQSGSGTHAISQKEASGERKRQNGNK